MPKQISQLNFNGINSDVSPYELPENVWSGGNNVRFDNDKTKKVEGASQVFGTTSGNPHWLLPFNTSTNNFWLYPSLTKIYKLSGSTHTDITRTSGGDYSATAASWNGGVLGGVAILNNGVDKPQQFGSSASNASDLSYWPSTYKTKVMRPFKEFLVALNTTEGSDNYPYRVMWSQPADAGTVPTSWVYTDATKDAGFVDLSQTGGFVVDCLPLRDVNVIYKEDSVYIMSHIGGAFIFDFSQIFSDAGILAQRCVQAFDDKHFVVGTDDVYIHNGQTKQSVIDNVLKDELFNSIHSSYYDRTFVAPNYKDNEMWVCFASGVESNTGQADKAFVWNYRTNKWSKRDLPDVSHISWGIVDDSGTYTSSYDADSGSWDSDSTPWDFRGYNPTQSALLLAEPTGNKLHKIDSYQNNGTSYLATVERTGLSLGTTLNKEIQLVVPRINGTGNVDFYVGTEGAPNTGVAWKGPYVVTPGVHSEIPVRANGKYIGIKVETTDDKYWSLDSLDIHWTPSGNRGTGV